MRDSVPPDDTSQLASGVVFGASGCLASLLCSVLCGFITYCILAYIVLPFASDQPSPPPPLSSDEYVTAGGWHTTDADWVQFLTVPLVFVAIIWGGILGIVIGSKRR
jgi:hypothetical protein